MVVEAVAVVDRGEVAHVVVLTDDLGQALPVLGRLPRQQVVLVGQRPPDGAMRAQPPGDVLHVPVVGRAGHLRKAPSVVRMEQDEVRLDPQLGELADTRLQMAEELRIETSEVPAAVAVAGERVAGRLVGVEEVGLGEHAHPELAERRVGQRGQRALLQGLALLGPRVAGRADGHEAGAVPVSGSTPTRSSSVLTLRSTCGVPDAVSAMPPTFTAMTRAMPAASSFQMAGRLRTAAIATSGTIANATAISVSHRK